MVEGPGERMDERTLREVYREHSASVYRRALQLLRDEDEALDVVQDVFERIVSGRHGEMRGRPLLLWMYRVTTNLCLNRLRDRKRRGALLQLHAEAVPVGHPGPSAAHVEAARVVALLARKSPEREVRAAILCYVDGATQEEAAELLQVTSRTIRNLLRRFEKRAERLLAREGGGTGSES